MQKRAAIVGLNWGARMHLSTLRAAGWDVQCIFGRDVGKSRAVALCNRVPHGSTDLSELSKQQFDLIVVAVPWWAHEEVARRVMGSARALLLEHPLAPTSGASQSLLGEAKRSGTRLYVNFAGRFLRPVKEMRSQLRGWSLDGVSIYHSFRFPSEEERDWLPLLMSHSIDLAQWLIGPIETASGCLWRRDTARVTDCPSWSWPLCAKDDGSYSAAGAANLVAKSRMGGEYRLRLGWGDQPEFVESVTAYHAAQDKLIRYATMLARQDEHSPWRASRLWEGRRGQCAELDWSGQPDDVMDIWHAAHVEQYEAIARDLVRGPSAELAADGDAAVRVQRLIESINW